MGTRKLSTALFLRAQLLQSLSKILATEAESAACTLESLKISQTRLGYELNV